MKKFALLLLICGATSAQTFISPSGAARRFVRVNGVPASCAAGDVMVDISVSPAVYYNCPVATPVVFLSGSIDASAITSGTLPTARGGTGNTTGTATVNANQTGPITSVGNVTSIASQTGTGTKFVVDTNPALVGPTTDTLQTSGNVGIGTTPSVTSGQLLNLLSAGNFATRVNVSNTDAADVSSAVAIRAAADTAITRVVAYGTANGNTAFGVTTGGYSTVDNGGAGNGLIIGTTNSSPVIVGTNSTRAVTISASSQAVSLRGTQTNDNATTGDAGEYQTGTVAANATSLSTGTTANVGANTNVTLAAGDWDCSGVVNFTFGATTSITNLTGGISTTTGTLPAQDSYFDYETSAIIPTGAAVATWVVPTVRLSNSTSTNVFLVSQATFTASTLKVGGTIRCRRMR